MTASPYFFVFRSSITASRMKFEGRGSADELIAASIVDEFALRILFVFYMGRGDSRRLTACDAMRVIICDQWQRQLTVIIIGGGLHIAWQIVFNAVVSFTGSASAGSSASGACRTKRQNAGKISPFSEWSRCRGCVSSPVRWRLHKPFSVSMSRCLSP